MEKTKGGHRGRPCRHTMVTIAKTYQTTVTVSRKYSYKNVRAPRRRRSLRFLPFNPRIRDCGFAVIVAAARMAAYFNP
jgi:hypothetical protein